MVLFKSTGKNGALTDAIEKHRRNASNNLPLVMRTLLDAKKTLETNQHIH